MMGKMKLINKIYLYRRNARLEWQVKMNLKL